jgi:hypothetical protein
MSESFELPWTKKLSEPAPSSSSSSSSGVAARLSGTLFFVFDLLGRIAAGASAVFGSGLCAGRGLRAMAVVEERGRSGAPHARAVRPSGHLLTGDPSYCAVSPIFPTHSMPSARVESPGPSHKALGKRKAGPTAAVDGAAPPPPPKTRVLPSRARKVGNHGVGGTEIDEIVLDVQRRKCMSPCLSKRVRRLALTNVFLPL